MEPFMVANALVGKKECYCVGVRLTIAGSLIFLSPFGGMM
jgi:hypothetical protein